MKLRSIFSSSLAVPYLLICGYGLFAVTTPPQPGEASDPSTPGVTQADKASLAIAPETTDMRDEDGAVE